jgi:hypothetical protein
MLSPNYLSGVTYFLVQMFFLNSFEFMEVITIKTVMKTSKKVKESSKSSSQKRHKSRGYNLAYLNLWWSRMTRDAQREEKEKKEQEEEMKKKRRIVKWFKPESRRRTVSKSRQDVIDDESSEIIQCSSQHSNSNLCQATISSGEGGIFKGANYQGVRVGAGVVTENDCATN